MAQQHLDSLRKRFLEAFNRGDGAAVASFYSADGKILPPNMPLIEGKQAITEFFNGAKEMGMQSLNLVATQAETSGDLAFEVGTYRADIQPPGGPAIIDAGKYTVVLRREAGDSWKKVVDMFNSDSPPPGH